MERKLATIRKIAELKPIVGADKIELAIVDGWQVVVKKGEFEVGELVIYLEIDSWVPTAVAPFLTKGAKFPKVFEGVEGERLKSIKLRGELSQGLVLPYDVLPEETRARFQEGADDYGLGDEDFIDTDVTEVLGIKKYEKPLAANLQGQARGYFPSFIRKTDQERIQNIFGKLDTVKRGHLYEITLKRDGSSTTFFHKDGETGVCSRNLELKIDESNSENAFVKKFFELDLDFKLRSLGLNIAIQGELFGSNINGNWEGISDIRFEVFDIFSIDHQAYLGASERRELVSTLGLDSVPLIGYNTLLPFETVEDFLKYADRPSTHNAIAEGVVFKSVQNPEFSFKAINNKYLLNGGE